MIRRDLRYSAPPLLLMPKPTLPTPKECSVQQTHWLTCALFKHPRTPKLLNRKNMILIYLHYLLVGGIIML